jgi:hypothetical protein
MAAVKPEPQHRRWKKPAAWIQHCQWNNTDSLSCSTVAEQTLPAGATARPLKQHWQPELKHDRWNNTDSLSWSNTDSLSYRMVTESTLTAWGTHGHWNNTVTLWHSMAAEKKNTGGLDNALPMKQHWQHELQHGRWNNNGSLSYSTVAEKTLPA